MDLVNKSDHPIFLESIRRIKNHLGDEDCNDLQNQVIQRVIHSGGDFALKSLLRFTENACEIGLEALLAGALLLTDTQMAAEAVRPMAKRTLRTQVRSVLEWAPKSAAVGSTRTARGMQLAWNEMSRELPINKPLIVLIGSSPTALNALLDLIAEGMQAPSLIIGMPVGFVGVLESKQRLSRTGLTHIRLEGTRGGASLAAAVINALLRASTMKTGEK